MPLLLLLLGAAWLLSSSSASAAPARPALEPPRDPGDLRPIGPDPRPSDPNLGLQPLELETTVVKRPPPPPACDALCHPGQPGCAPCAVTGPRRYARRLSDLM